MNPKSVIFDQDEIDKITRIRMVKWVEGMTFAEWDAMSYGDQCFLMEVRRADNENAKYDAAKRRR